MFKRSTFSLALAAVVLTACSVTFAHEGHFSAVCPVSGKAAVKDKTVDYKGGKVYLCCGNCVKKFAKDSTKFAAKANHQLVSTGQAKQVKCPMSGKPCDASKTVKISKVSVAFCCNNCLGAAKKATGDDQLKLAFSDKAFAKGFEVTKKKKD